MFLKTGVSDYGTTLADAEVLSSIRLTLFTSMVGTLIFGVMSIPLAYLLARKNFFLKGLVNGLIDIPVVIP
ncbi:MAG: molybdenum ABC transporter permease, partial [Bacteroidota bacterium]